MVVEVILSAPTDFVFECSWLAWRLIEMFRLLVVAVVIVINSVTAMARADEEKGFKPLFDGKSLQGWEGDQALWHVHNKMIVGKSPGIKRNEFLATKKEYGDFELRLEFRLLEGKGNSGIQFRSRRAPRGHGCIGYQADIGQNYWGCLYDEERRRKVLVQAPPELGDKLRKTGWNSYTIRAEGDRVMLTINGVKTVDYVEKDEEIAQTGIIALQIHSGPAMQIDFRNIRIKELP